MVLLPRFSALILAGGASSRMGQDKALLHFNGKTLLAHMQQLASACGASEVLISRNQQGFIQDCVNHYQLGPLAGVFSALSFCHSEYLLVLPIDTPLLSISSLQQLLQESNGRACYFRDNPLPCVLPVNNVLGGLINTQLQMGQHSVKALLDVLQAITLPAPVAELLNTNTPAEWLHCLQQQQNASSA